MLLDFLNVGESLFIILIVLGVIWLGLIIYCIRDITVSSFRPAFMKLIFLLLVLFAPVLGCIIYLAIKKEYKISV